MSGEWDDQLGAVERGTAGVHGGAQVQDLAAELRWIRRMESSAKAQHAAALVRPGALLAGFRSFSATINGQPIDISSLPEQTFRAEYAGQWDEPDTSPLEDLIRAANQPRMSGTLVMSQGTARALHDLLELRSESTFGVDGHRRVIDAMAGEQVWVVPNDFIAPNPSPRGPAPRKRRGR